MASDPRPDLGEIRQRLEVLVPAIETRQRLKEQVGGRVSDYDRDVVRLLRDLLAVLPQESSPQTIEQLAAAQGVKPIEDLSALAMGESPIDDGTVETRLRTLAGKLCKPECNVWMAEAAAVMVQDAAATITALRQQLAHWQDCHGVTADRLVAAEARVSQLEQQIAKGQCQCVDAHSPNCPEAQW